MLFPGLINVSRVTRLLKLSSKKLTDSILYFTLIIPQLALAQSPDTVLAHQHYLQARQLGDAANYDSSIYHYQEAVAKYEIALSWEGYVKSLNGLGACYTLTSRHDKAQEYLQLALSVGLEKLGEVPAVADTYQNLGFDWSRQGDYEKQFHNYERTKEIRIGSFGMMHPKVAQIHSSLAVSYQFLGDYETALKYAMTGLEINLKLLDSDDFNLSQSYTNVGAIYLSKGENRRAQNYFQLALDVMINATGEQNQFKAIGYSNLGKSYDAQGYYDEAINAYKNAIDILVQTLGEQHVYVGIFYNNLGAAWLSNGDAGKASEFHQKALEIFSVTLPNVHPYMAFTYINLGRCFGESEDSVKALNFFREGLDIQEKVLGFKHPEYANSCHIIGSYFSDLGRGREALSYFQKALNALVEDFSDSDSYSNPILSGINSKRVLLDVLRSKAKTLKLQYHRKTNNLSDLNASLATNQVALKLIDQLKFETASAISRQELVEKSMPIYEETIETSFELFKINGDEDFLRQAYIYSEKSKAFLLRQALKDSEAQHYADIPDSVINQERNLKIKSAFYEGQLHTSQQNKDSAKVKLHRKNLLEAKLEFENFREEIESQYPKYFELKYDNAVTSVAEVQERLLDQNSLLLEYFVGDDRMYVFSITKHAFHAQEIKKTAYEKLVKDYRAGLTDYQLILDGTPIIQQSYLNAANGLFELLLQQPVGAVLQDVEKVIIIPDGKLNYLSFEALLTSLPSDLDHFRYKDLDYLIKHYSVSYSYSSTSLKNILESSHLWRDENVKFTFGGFAPEYPESPLIFPRGNSEESVTYLPNTGNMSLPGAIKEVQTIADKFHSQAWLGSLATERIFKDKANEYQILHLSMHGVLDDTHPMFSKLLFTQNQDSLEDGYLNAAEIYNLSLNADLSILSACNSGFGIINKGEGMMSLSRAFAYAGCPSLVTSLWQVPDDAAVPVMVDFYDYIIEGLPKDEALRKAKLNYLQNIEDPLYEHPFFWAGFINVGDVGSLVIKESKLAWAKLVMVPLIGGMVFLFLFRRRKPKTA